MMQMLIIVIFCCIAFSLPHDVQGLVQLSEGNSTCKHRTYPTNSTIKPVRPDDPSHCYQLITLHADSQADSSLQIDLASTISELRWLGGKGDADKVTKGCKPMSRRCHIQAVISVQHLTW